MNRLRNGWLLIMGLTFAGGAAAALINRGGGLIYDTDLNVTWLADANYAKTSGYTDSLYGPGSDGRMTWGQAIGWVSQLVYHDPVRNRDLRGWRLPVTPQPDPSCSMQLNGDSIGYNCTGSELGHLFYKELGGKAATSIRTTHNANYALFANAPASLYWSGTSYAQDPSRAWGFLFDSGSPLLGGKGDRMYVLPLRPGDVGAPGY
jgi:hypothetical protein